MTNFRNIAGIFSIAMIAYSCNQQNGTAQTTQIESPDPNIFPRGEKITNDNFTGTAYLHLLVTGVYVKQDDRWMLGSLSFTRLLDQ